MSTLSPRSLLFLTVDYVARNYRQLCDVQEDQLVHVITEQHHISDFKLLVFKNNYYLPSNICELLLQRFFFHHDNSLPAEYLTLFTDPERCPLKRICMGNVNREFLVYKTSSFLFQNEVVLKMIMNSQKLLELDFGSLYNSELLSADFSKSKCAATLRRLTMFDEFNIIETSMCSAHVVKPPTFATYVSFITNFTNLKHLSLTNCHSVNDRTVTLFASAMIHLESLDLSSTGIAHIDVFEKVATKLKVLIIHNTPLAHYPTHMSKFSNLHHLDISQNSKFNDVSHTNYMDRLYKFLTSEKSLEFLQSLDISGAGMLHSDALQSFLDNHRKLCFLGLLNVHHKLSNAVLENIEVTGDSSLEQVLACLRHYKNRPEYLTKALKKMFTFSCSDNLKQNVELRKKIIEMLLGLMRKYMDMNNEDLHTAASACLYNYVRYDTEKETNSLHVSILSDMVAVVIQVLQTFPRVQQIQRNCLVVLYNKYVLSAAKFNAYQLSDLLFKATMLIPEGNVTGIALDMCAYLSSSISVAETLKLGTIENIKKLLSIISAQVDNETVNNLLLCSLRVLWNLTDEAPETCRLVIDFNGLPLAFRALETFDDKNEVLTKLLGVMNNLAEVVKIRPILMCDEFVSLLRKYLDMDYAMDVSYFAAGTLCNLILDWRDGFKLPCGTKSEFLFSVGSAVNRWKKMDSVMVGYRTFKSFLPLLNSPFPDVQLWAIWAIHHVTSQKVERYGQLCCDEGIVDTLQMKATSVNRSDVQDLAVQALDSILKR